MYIKNMAVYFGELQQAAGQKIWTLDMFENGRRQLWSRGVSLRNRWRLWLNNVKLTLLILYTKIQQITPGEEGLLIQAGFLLKFYHFHNSWLIPRPQGGESSQHQDSPGKWSGIARALVVGHFIFRETKNLLHSFKSSTHQKRGFESKGCAATVAAGAAAREPDSVGHHHSLADW